MVGSAGLGWVGTRTTKGEGGEEMGQIDVFDNHIKQSKHKRRDVIGCSSPRQVKPDLGSFWHWFCVLCVVGRAWFYAVGACSKQRQAEVSSSSSFAQNKKDNGKKERRATTQRNATCVLLTILSSISTPTTLTRSH